MKKEILRIIILTVFSAAVLQIAQAQTFEFTYQGSLKSGGAAATGNHDFEFALFDAASGGAQIGSTLTRTNVAVVDGTFSVQLNFGNNFLSPNRFLEIRVRPAAGGAFTTLTPRQPVTSSPYSIVSVSAVNAVNATNATNATNAATATNATNAATATNALQLGGVAANQFIQTSDPRLSNARNPLPGSGNYIQNTNTLQKNASFFIGGSGAVTGTLLGNIVAANTQFNLGGNRILSAPPGGNTFVGLNAGINSTGSFNSFFGQGAGNLNTSGDNNSFFGTNAGMSTTTGVDNASFGVFAGSTNSTGSGNSYFGNRARGDAGISNATAIGSRAFVTRNNSLILGGISGVNGGVDTNVGIGTTAPTERLDIGVNGGRIIFGGGGCPSGSVSIGLNGAFGNCLNYTIRGDTPNLLINRPTGGDILFRENNGSTQVRIRAGGALAISVLGAAGATSLCRNASNEISTCSSSMRYKSDVKEFRPGLSLVRKLRPVSFDWKSGGARDLGLVAEEVAEVAPLLTTTNDKGEIEGVKYDRVGIVLVNAVNEQQTQIESLEKQINEQAEIIKSQDEKLLKQQAQLDALKQLVCVQNPSAELCQPKK